MISKDKSLQQNRNSALSRYMMNILYFRRTQQELTKNEKSGQFIPGLPYFRKNTKAPRFTSEEDETDEEYKEECFLLMF